jgi:tRNA threonylcarbamoyladenosine biosynthesis protein TsaE
MPLPVDGQLSDASCMCSIFLEDEVATQRLGAAIATASKRGTVFLQGELGAGKTTLVRGLIRALGFTGPVKSPTYTLVEPYNLGDRRIYHLDLYRLDDPEELELMGVRDYFDTEALCLVEWPERGEEILPAPDLRVQISREGVGRRVMLSSTTELGAALASAIETAISAP